MGKLYSRVDRLISELYSEKGTTMLPVNQRRSFNAFYDSARGNEILEPKTTLMVHLAAAMAVGCDP